MNFLGGYGSDSDNEKEGEDKVIIRPPQPQSISTFGEYKPVSQVLCVAPIVPVSSAVSNTQLIKHDQLELRNNPRANVVLAPQNGPAHPFRFNVTANGSKQQAGMGQIEETNIESWTFDEQYQTFQRSGFAIDSETNVVLGDYKEFVKSNGDTAQTARGM
jgi:hypothetical protein